MGIFDEKKKKYTVTILCGTILASLTFLSIFFFIFFRNLPWYVPVGLFFSTAAITLVSRWVKNPRLLALRHGIELFGALINNVVVWAALFVVYVVGIGVTALFARLVGKKFIRSQIDYSAESWWEPLDLSLQERERYYDMF